MAGHNGYVVATADGKILAKTTHLSDALRDGLAAWNALPEAERKPRLPNGIKKVEGMSYPPSPPRNGLILKVHIRALQRDPAMAAVVAESRTPVVIMHNRDAADPALDIMADIEAFFARSLALASQAGIGLWGSGLGTSWALSAGTASIASFTVAGLTPWVFAMERTLQWVASFGVRCRVVSTKAASCAAEISFGRPERGRSSRMPASPSDW